MGRRDDVIGEAVHLLRTGGPAALTSANVAGALGVTQSAIYRHVRDMNELEAIASDRIVAELTAIVDAALTDPAIEWGAPADTERISARLGTTIVERSQDFEVVDRRRWESGPLGEGIRDLLARTTGLISDLIDAEWHAVHGTDRPFDDRRRTLVAAHAQLLQDDVLAVARAARADGLDVDDTAALLTLRLQAGWYAFCLDVNPLDDLPAPALAFR